jgi:cytochrome c oxidase subunit 3
VRLAIAEKRFRMADIAHAVEASSAPAPFLAHHFDNPVQQRDAATLGMWLFLATEILLFAGLFCCYAVLRTTRPEITAYGAQFLDSTWGTINTFVLISSSFTMALAVKFAGTKHRAYLIAMLLLTFFLGVDFLVVKYIEYSHKFHENLVWGVGFYEKPEQLGETTSASHGTPKVHHSQDPNRPVGAHIFFGLYFAMTGLHGIHVILGLIVILWLTKRAAQGDFGPEYSTPVDLGGLYWHVVDIIWIFLFPLLYLI